MYFVLKYKRDNSYYEVLVEVGPLRHSLLAYIDKPGSSAAEHDGNAQKGANVLISVDDDACSCLWDDGHVVLGVFYMEVA